MSELRRPIAEQLKDPATEPMLQQGWRELELRRRPRAGRSWIWPAAVAAALAAIVVYLVAGGGRPSALEVNDGRPLAAAIERASTQRDRIELSDDSKIELTPKTRLVLGENAPGRLHLILQSGKVDLDVRSRGRTAWRIDAGELTVEVVGTRLSIERGADGVSVDVFEGRVRVSGAQLSPPVRYLGAGERFTTAAPEREDEPSVDAPEEPSATRSDPVVPPRSKPKSTPAPQVEPRAEPPQKRDDPEARLRLADEARRRGDPMTAAEHLRAVAAGTDGRAALASLALGRILLDELRDARGAEVAFARALELPLPEAMREIAWARRVEARSTTGDHEGARELARQYRERFPNGRFARDVDRWSAP